MPESRRVDVLRRTGAASWILLLVAMAQAAAADEPPPSSEDLERLDAARRSLPRPDYAALRHAQSNPRAPDVILVDTAAGIGHATVAILREDGSFLIGCGESGPLESHDHAHPAATAVNPQR